MIKHPPSVALDMDNVLANWDEGLVGAWKRTTDKPFFDYLSRKTYYVEDQAPHVTREELEALFHSPGFYRDLPPVEGGLEAAREMKNMGWDVILLTAPTLSDTCHQEKIQWVREHLGSLWVGRVYIALDKTRIRADYLIDDKPEVEGVYDPHWEHLVYDAPYNRHVVDKRRLTWRNWKEVLGVSSP